MQQQIFEREDTAVQRRMADLEAAGINPNLAAGSAASAGSVVSRSNTNDLGSALDTVQALNSIKQQKQAVENQKIENEIKQKVQIDIDKSQKEYYLRQQMKTISEELDESENLQKETEEYKAKVAQAIEYDLI